MATDRLIESIVESKLTEFNEIINTNHRGFIVDIDIKKYFAVDSSSYDQNQGVTLDPTRRSHQKLFKEKLDEYIDQIGLEDLINKKCNRSITGKELDKLDDTIRYVLNAARKHAEGMKRTIKESSRKIKIRSTLLYYSALLKQAEGK